MSVELEDDEFEVVTPSDGTNLLENHEILSVAARTPNTLASLVGLVKISGLRVGHAFPTFLLKTMSDTAEWSSYVWTATYMVSAVDPFYAIRLGVRKTHAEDFPSIIEINLDNLHAKGILCFNVTGFQAISQAIRDAVPSGMTFVPEGHQLKGLLQPGQSMGSQSVPSDPPMEVMMHTDAKGACEAKLAVVSRLLDNNKTALLDFFGGQSRAIKLG